jgi:threonine/homoserine/homoserine lactone efflux protein
MAASTLHFASASGLTEIWQPYVMFWLGYVVLTLAPGPSMMLVGVCAACRGLRGTITMIACLALGGAALAATLFVVAGLAAPLADLKNSIGLANAALLCFVAWRIFLIRDLPPCEEVLARRSFRSDCLTGLAVGFTNPLTIAYLLSQYLARTHEFKLGGSALILALGVLAIMLFRLTIIALLLSQPSIRSWVRRRLRFITLAAGMAIAGMAAGAAAPTLRPLAFSI